MIQMTRLKVAQRVGSALLLLSFASAQTTTTPTTSQVRMPGAVTGAQVPDSVAYRMVFLSLSVPVKPTKDDLAIQKSIAASIGLNEADTAALLLDVSDFKTKYADFYAQLGTSMIPTALAFRSRRDGLVQEGRSDLQSHLSSAGLAGLDAFVVREKNRIETVPEQN
jgi:hypothetical protein